MGMFVNPGNQAFQVAVNSEIYKSRVGKPTVLTVGVCQMIHLGYLGYDQTRKMTFVPNEEIRQELTIAVESKPWNEMITFQQESTCGNKL